jgi:aminoglycoside 6-adenylyltransferase
LDDVTVAYAQLIERFVRWAENEDNIRSAIMIGSRARLDHPADEWSDLDIIMFAHDPKPYWERTDWLYQIGKPWLMFLEPTPDGRGFERRVLFEGGLDVDFVPDVAADLWSVLDQGFPPGLADMVRRGIRFLVDKDGVAERFWRVKVPPPLYSPPAESEFLNLVNDFWYHTVWTGKHLRRGEIWWAKSCCDTYLKNLLLRMLEWHARASSGGEVDTWMRGRFLEEWADPRAVEALPKAFAHYDETDTWRALKATMTLFRWLAVETADLLHYSYPSLGARRATEFVEGLYLGRKHT